MPISEAEHKAAKEQQILGAALSELAKDQSEWSQATFGKDSDRGPIGALRHLAKEAEEAIDAIPYGYQSLRTELADCLLLILDAARRSGVLPIALIAAAQAKMVVNRERTWPKPVDDMPVEHTREFRSCARQFGPY